MKQLDNAAKILALLFASPQPITAKQLARITGLSLDELDQHLQTIKNRLENSGLQLNFHDDQYRLVTDPAAAATVSQLQSHTSADLTPAALETLAIVAYRQPVSRHDIDSLRGVSSEIMVAHLTSQGLIEQVGVTDTPEHSPLYQTTMMFLEIAGLPDMKALPPIEDDREA